MKLILITSVYGGRVCVRVQYSNFVYFKGAQPADTKLVTLDLPGLKENTYPEVLNWLKTNGDSAEDLNRREINEFPESCWRNAVLDDYLEAGNFHETIWQINAHFSAEEFDRFGDKWISPAQQKLKNALQTEIGPSRIEAFDEIKDFLERVYYVMDKTPYRLTTEIEEMRKVIENAKFAEVKEQTEDLAEWIETVETFKSYWSIQTALNEIAREMKTRRLPSDEVLNLIEKFGVNLRLQTNYSSHPFWTNVSPLLRFEQNLTDEEIDLTETKEEKVQIGWDLINGKRVGTVVPGRNALIGTYPDGDTHLKLYVSGERKLKFQIQRNHGKLRKFGCTLTLENQSDQKSIQPALLEVEKIDALANLDIEQALEKIAPLNLPKNHLVYYTAEKAGSDPRQARVLADLLIELLVGVDADIARQLARAQSRGNRK
jgi:hypothetical protein